jgi:alpha-muurolene/germacrene-A/gamma-muurolene/(+)-delta-cadinol synthase
VSHNSLTRSCSLWLRCTRNGGAGFQARLKENLGLFFDARHLQSKHRQTGIIPTTQEYIDIRRDSSGLKPLIDFLEYTLDIDLPDFVIEDPIMSSLKQCVNDFCTWSNVRMQTCRICTPFSLLSHLGSILIQQRTGDQ